MLRFDKKNHTKLVEPLENQVFSEEKKTNTS